MAICKNCGGIMELRFMDFSRRYCCPYCENNEPAESDDYELKVQSAYNYFQVQANNKRYEEMSFALSRFEEIIKLNPSDPRGWWGKALCLTKNFTLMEYDENIFKCAQRAYDLAPEYNKKDIKQKWNAYADMVNGYFDNDYKGNIAKINSENDSLAKNYNKMINQISRKRNAMIISRIVGLAIVVIYNIIAFSVLLPMIPQRIYSDGGVVGVIIGFVLGDWIISVVTGVIAKSSKFSWLPPVLSGICSVEAIIGMLRGGFFMSLMVIIVFGAVGAGITAAASTSFYITSKLDEELPQVPTCAPYMTPYPSEYKKIPKL